MKKTLIFALFAIVFSAHAVAGEIPVYPGAKPEINKEDANTACCPLATRDPFDKVVAFYEKAFKAKAMDIKTIAAKYQAYQKTVEEMKRQAPPGFKFVGIVRGETVYNGQKLPQLFEITYSPASGTTSFVIDEEDLAPTYGKLVYEYRKKTGQMKEPAELAYEEWFANHRQTRQGDHVIPVYPGSYVEEGSEECSNKSCCTLSLLTTDTIEKVAAFYREKGLKEMPRSEDSHYEFDDVQFEVVKDQGKTYVHGNKGSVNRIVIIIPANEQGNGVPLYPVIDRKTRSREARYLPTVRINLESQALDSSCVESPLDMETNGK